MSEINTTRPRRPAHIRRSLWRQIWAEPDSFFPEERPEYIPAAQWEPITKLRPSHKKTELLLEVELELADSNAVQERAQIMEAIDDSDDLLDIFEYYGEVTLERVIGPRWSECLSLAPPQNVYDFEYNN